MTSRTLIQWPSAWRFLVAIGGAFAAWVVQFAVNYVLVDYGCGTNHRIAIGVISAIALAAALASAYVAWSLWESARAVPPDHDDAIDLFHAGSLFGLLTSGLFLGLVILTGVATVVLKPCVH